MRLEHRTYYRRQLIRYILNYTIIFTFILIACCPFIWQTYQSVQENTEKQITSRLEEGVDNLYKTIDNLYVSGLIMSQDSNIRELSSIKGELPLENHITMNYVKDQILNLYMANNHLSSAIMLFPDNDIMISSEDVSESFENYYGEFFGSPDISAKEFRRQVFGAKELISFISVDELAFYNFGKKQVQKNPLIACLKINSAQWVRNLRFVLVLVMDKEQIIEWMTTEDIREECSIQIKNQTQDTVFEYGAKGHQHGSGDKSWQTLTRQSSDYGLNISIEYPKSAVKSNVENSFRLLLLYLIIGLLIAGGLGIYFSYKQYRPLKDLKDAVSKEAAESIESVNEFEYISNGLSSIILSKNEYKMKLDQIESSLQSSTIEKLMLRGDSTKEEQEKMEEFLKVPIDAFCIASLLIVETAAEYPAVTLRMQRYLQEQMPDQFICICSDFQELIFLFLLPKEEIAEVNSLKLVFSNLAQKVTEESGTIINVGLSMVRKDIKNMNICYNQALQARWAYASEIANSVGIYSLKPDHIITDFMNVETIQRMKNHLLGADRSLIEQQMDTILKMSGKAATPIEFHQQQIFYFLRHTIWCTMEELAISEDKVILPIYEPSWNLSEMLQTLKNSCFQICDYLDENKRSKNLKLKAEVTRYLQEEYMRCDLTAAIVCQTLGISEKYMFQFIKEQTGKTFIGYLEELRMEKAEELLISGNYSNIQIAEISGFGSVNTLYRAFNKYKGLPPAAYKKMVMNKNI